ncbi:TIGR03621 family F420-dependent LLM class oxidoreductase [Gordonia paraffinivorans]|uniref:TIGR03621 family F420-dependent LLM class oxidoreductase n=1 Tax=Gordonia paraffinivorans TaxID=175628 RepID=UPI001FFBFA4A|nr:TIGR03621 family F420-dependent LLM class oxidoreductase [Gordonia paraffinivorans]
MSLASRAFRFGVNMLAVGDITSWRDRVRRAGELGYDVLLVPDHLGIPSPWPALAVAAQASGRLRVGTFVLNAAFTNPALLARDAATVDQLSDGRVENGIGTGYAREEFESAGIDYLAPGRRVDHLAATVQKTRSLLSDPEFTPRPVQARIPLLLGGNGDRVLRLAAEHADVVGYTARGAHRQVGADDESAGVPRPPVGPHRPGTRPRRPARRAPRDHRDQLHHGSRTGLRAVRTGHREVAGDRRDAVSPAPDTPASPIGGPIASRRLVSRVIHFAEPG